MSPYLLRHDYLSHREYMGEQLIFYAISVINETSVVTVKISDVIWMVTFFVAYSPIFIGLRGE